MIKTILIIIACLAVAASCTKKSPTATATMSANTGAMPYKDISVAEAQQMLDSNADIILLDVRTPTEIAAGAIDGHQAIDFRSSDFRETISKLDKEAPYIVYCRSGGRSANTAQMMQEMGFVEVHNVLGGYNEWSKQ